MVIDNSFGQECHQFELSFWRSMQDEGIIFLIFHLMYVLKAQGKKGLLKPLDILARDPASMKVNQKIRIHYFSLLNVLYYMSK